MKSVIIDDEAEHELAESIAFYESREHGLGLEFAAVVRAAVNVIANDPTRHIARPDGSRKCSIRRFPFVIYYVDLPETIWILAFAHTSRKPRYWKRRL